MLRVFPFGLYHGFAMRGLYVHIPFCIQKCHYCDFVITVNRSAAARRDFLSCLEKEIEHNAARLKEKVFDTLYLGGGTPSVLSLDESQTLFRRLRKSFRFRENAEITVEVNPGDVTKERAALYKNLGVNRVSLGAQSFREKTLRAIHRCHGRREIHESFECLRRESFGNINIDLILSLPGEGTAEAMKSLEETARLGPEHISLYELTIEKGTVFGEKHRKGQLLLPEEDVQMRTLEKARVFLKQSGYEHYELLNYSKPGFRSRHNMLYWANEEYLGLGPGAYSYLEGSRYRYALTVREYLEKIHKENWTLAEEEILSPERREIESLLLSLRTSGGADRRRFSGLLPRLRGSLDSLSDTGLIEEDHDTIRLTSRGQFFAESVFTELSSY